MLAIAVLIEIVSSAPDAMSISTVVALGLSVAAITATEIWLSARRSTAVADMVREASGIVLTPREAAHFAAAANQIQSAFAARDVREPLSAQFVSVRSQPGLRLRVMANHPAFIAPLEPA